MNLGRSYSIQHWDNQVLKIGVFLKTGVTFSRLQSCSVSLDFMIFRQYWINFTRFFWYFLDTILLRRFYNLTNRKDEYNLMNFFLPFSFKGMFLKYNIDALHELWTCVYNSKISQVLLNIPSGTETCWVVVCLCFGFLFVFEEAM